MVIVERTAPWVVALTLGCAAGDDGEQSPGAPTPDETDGGTEDLEDETGEEPEPEPEPDPEPLPPPEPPEPEPDEATCTSDADCDAGGCIAGQCVVASTCAELHERLPELQSGAYPLQFDEAAPPITAWCDMATEGGGWTVVYASDATDGNVAVVSFEVRHGNPLLFEHYNLHVLDKIAVNDQSTEMLVRRPGTRWLVADVAPFSAELSMPATERYFETMLRASDGTSANGWIGWSNHHIAAGGDFGITASDGETCAGSYYTTQGFDHHNEAFWLLNCDCDRHYLYSFSSAVEDGDASYKVSEGLGSWNATTACSGGESDGDPLYIAIR